MFLRQTHVLLIASISLLIAAAPTHAEEKKPDSPEAKKTPATQPATVKKMNVEEFDKARAEKSAVVLDVRSAEEFASGHVPGAVNIPVTGKGSEEFDKAVKAIDSAAPVLVHCRSGKRSAIAIEKLKKMGFSNLAELPGGWVAWSEAGKPVEKGNGSGQKSEK